MPSSCQNTNDGSVHGRPARSENWKCWKHLLRRGIEAGSHATTHPTLWHKKCYFETRHHAMLLVIAHHCSPALHLLNLAHSFTSFHCPIQNYKNNSDSWNAKAWASPTRLRLTLTWQDRISKRRLWKPSLVEPSTLRRASVSKTTEAKVVHPCWPSCGQSARIDPLQNGHPRVQLQK